jgi:alpha-methylacyl-CoA racemase
MSESGARAKKTKGPLQGLRVVEMGAIGPVPFCGMMLADMGADVIRVDRPNTPRLAEDVTARNKRLVYADLQDARDLPAVQVLVGSADVLLEGFRPGVMERMGLGPAPCHERNSALVYGRMTGWGQTGPLASAAGHDINYIALTGALHAMGRGDEAPPPPLNLVGDYGGGAMLLAVGILAALRESQACGKGQVVDAAMVDGSALLLALFYGLKAQHKWTNRRGSNLLDGGAPHYDTYACADGKFVAIGPLEPKFFAEFCARCGLDEDFTRHQQSRAHWPLMKLRLRDMFLTKTRDEWCSLLEGTDACFAPVLDWDEAPDHPHNRSRDVFFKIGDVIQPSPAPRFSRTPSGVPEPFCTTSLDALVVEWQRAADTSTNLGGANAH